MGFRIRLYDGPHEVGFVEFRSLLAQNQSDYTMEPGGLLTPAELRELAEQLRHLPARSRGWVGEYRWREDQTE